MDSLEVMDTVKDMGMVIMEVVVMDMVIMVIMEGVDMDIMERVGMDIMEEEGMKTTTKAITMENDLSEPLNILQMKILKQKLVNMVVYMALALVDLVMDMGIVNNGGK